jgi:hypothetical protein
MKIKILKVYELNGVLRVETECDYGKDNLGLSLQQKYLNPVTQKPRYLDEVASLLKKKYEKAMATEKAVNKSEWGKEIEI